MYPSKLDVVGGQKEFGGATQHTFGYALHGSLKVQSEHGSLDLKMGGWFALAGVGMVTVAAGDLAVLITRFGYRGQYAAGRIEERGRLSYIDGCSDSMLYYPPRLGDPVLNHLHFPPGIVQSQHTHPSIRLGIVARGKGHAFGPKVLGEGDTWTEELSHGCVFLLHPQEMHSFRTDTARESMDVIAYHPDSDWGPTDQAHPMLNRTFIGANVFNHGG